MKLGISTKLFFAVVITTVVSIAIMAITIRHNFRHGFLNYINTTEIENLALISDKLLKIYQDQGGWRFLRENPRLGKRLMRSLGREWRHHSMHQDMHMPEAPHNAALPLLNRLTLLDETQQYLAGNKDFAANATLVPVKTSNNQVIAWLGYHPATALSETVDIQFQQSQVNTSLVISVIAIVFSALIAIMLSRQFLMPIKQLVSATRKLAQGELETRVKVKSQDEFGQLTRDFNQLAETLADQQRARHQWLADISHELRTPVAILRGEIEALQDGVRTANEQTLASLHSEVLRLNSLIEDLYQLSLSDIGALDYQKTQVQLLPIVKDVIASFNAQCQKKSLQVTSELDGCAAITLYADEQRLRQLLVNLFQNSVRYTDEHGQIKISCERNQGNVIIRWMDSAPGVSDADLTKLFDRLYRVDPSRDRKSGGAGLGLSICKNIVKAHDGTISATHSSLGGLCLNISLPIDKSESNVKLSS